MTVGNTFLSETRVQAARVISPVGDLTAATMPELRRSVARSLSEGAGRIIIDLSGVAVFDGFGREALAACSRAADAAHASLVVTGMPSARSRRGDDATTSSPNTQAATRCTGGMQPRDGWWGLRPRNDHGPGPALRRRRRSSRGSPGDETEVHNRSEAQDSTRGASMMRLARLGLRRDRSCPPAHTVLASELAIGDKLEVDRGRRVDAVRSVARHDGSRTVDCLFESGRRRTYQFDADVSIRSH